MLILASTGRHIRPLGSYIRMMTQFYCRSLWDQAKVTAISDWSLSTSMGAIFGTYCSMKHTLALSKSIHFIYLATILIETERGITVHKIEFCQVHGLVFRIGRS